MGRWGQRSRSLRSTYRMPPLVEVACARLALEENSVLFTKPAQTEKDAGLTTAKAAEQCLALTETINAHPTQRPQLADGLASAPWSGGDTCGGKALEWRRAEHCTTRRPSCAQHAGAWPHYTHPSAPERCMPADTTPIPPCCWAQQPIWRATSPSKARSTSISPGCHVDILVSVGASPLRGPAPQEPLTTPTRKKPQPKTPRLFWFACCSALPCSGMHGHAQAPEKPGR